MENIIQEICKFILNNLYDDITISKLENEFNYNKYYLIRMFKYYTGYTIKEFTNTIKVLKTIDPLLFTNDTILKIALNHGFNSQEYYSETFNNIIGISPLKFRKEYSRIDEINNIKELKEKKEYILYLNQYKKMILRNTSRIEKNDNQKKLLKSLYK